MSDDDCKELEGKRQLPVVDAILAATLALMTGYSQALQADTHPRQRLAMGENIVVNLGLLRDRAELSTGLREILRSLQRCWLTMSACTRDAAGDCGAGTDEGHGSWSADSAALGRGAVVRRLH